MTRTFRVGVAQLGAIDRKADRTDAVNRMIALLEKAKQNEVKVVVFPELAFTTFFPRYHITDEEELESYYENEDVVHSANVKRFFDKAKELGLQISVGFGERCNNGDHYNSCAFVDGDQVISKYRKIHLPGTKEPFPGNTVHQLEKRYFAPGNLGFTAFRVRKVGDVEQPIFGQLICNDRRWAEAWRALCLQGCELVMVGYNTTNYLPQLTGADTNITLEESEADANFHHKLVMQAHSYTNSVFSACSARTGYDDGKYGLIAGSMIVNPQGKILAESKTTADELIFADINLDECKRGRSKTFDFGRHRRIENYGIIAEQTGIKEIPLLS